MNCSFSVRGQRGRDESVCVGGDPGSVKKKKEEEEIWKGPQALFVFADVKMEGARI